MNLYNNDIIIYSFEIKKYISIRGLKMKKSQFRKPN